MTIKPKACPISEAKRIASDYGYDQVVIITRKCGDGGAEHCTTYGVNAEHCSVAARIGDFLKHKVMGWACSEPNPDEAKAVEAVVEAARKHTKTCVGRKCRIPLCVAIRDLDAIRAGAKEKL